MTLPSTPSDFGPIMQLAFLPEDFDAALRYWTETMGVGPFTLLDGIELGDMRCMGEPSHARFGVAIAYWNDMQIELIRPENDAPAHYTGGYKVHDRVHHVCVVVDDMDAVRAALDAAGATIVVEGKVGDDGYVIYADPGTGPGGLIEYVKLGAGGAELFAMIRESAKGWDGSEPLRRLG